MIMKEDTTFEDLCANSVKEWLSEMEGHDDLTVRGGVKLTRDYISSLKRKIAMLEEKNMLKDNYLRKMSGK